MAGYSKSFENFNYVVSAVLTPMFLLAGSFFPLDELPEWAQVLAALNPLYHWVELVRDAVFGFDGWTDLLSFGYLVLFGVIMWRIAIHAMTRKLIDSFSEPVPPAQIYRALSVSGQAGTVSGAGGGLHPKADALSKSAQREGWLRVRGGSLPAGVRTALHSLLPLPERQRQTGSAFVINLLIEADRVGPRRRPGACQRPSSGGRNEDLGCPTCRIAVYSQYTSPKVSAVCLRRHARRPASVAPDVTSSRGRSSLGRDPRVGAGVQRLLRLEEAVRPAEEPERLAAVMKVARSDAQADQRSLNL